ncbi:MAG TPA: glycosyltransferase family 2 protein, partial [Thermoanaerobaculia bacterium]
VAQDFAEFEFIVIDDGSTDATPAILQRWASRDPRFVILRNERNLGISTSLNKGLDAAHGAYIARQDADDISEPGRFRAQVELLDAQSDVVLVSTNYHVIDGAGNILQTTQLDHPSALIEFLLLFSNALGGHSQVMFRRNAIRDLGAYSTEFLCSQDYELWTRVVRRGRIVVLPQPGMRYRVHDSRITVRESDRQIEESWGITRRMLNAYLGRELSDAELCAIASVWRQHLPSTRPDLASAVFAEAYRVFARHADASLRRRARTVAAQRFAITGAAMLRQGSVIGALRHFAYSLRWDPFGLAKVVLRRLRAR